MIVSDLDRGAMQGRLAMHLSETPVMSDLDPDAFGILCRNLVENALLHSACRTTVDVTLSRDGMFCVANEGPTLSPDILERLATRFERAGSETEGSGLGLAIVAAIAERADSELVLLSPRPGHSSGFEARVRLPGGLLNTL
jgi:two-component system OmpR family sensor kinase